MRLLSVFGITASLLLLSGCSEDTPVDPEPQEIPVITQPVSGTSIARLKVDVRGTAEPDKALEVFVDEPRNKVTAYASASGQFHVDDLPLGGQGRRVIWARMTGDTTLVSQPVWVDVDYSEVAYPVVFFPPHGSKIPAASVPVGGFAPDDVEEVEIYRDGTRVATVDAEDGSFVWPNFEPTGAGNVSLYARGILAQGGYTAYGESIAVEVGGGESARLQSFTSPVDDTLLSESVVSVAGTASEQTTLGLYINGGDTGHRATAVGGSFTFSPVTFLIEGPHHIGVVSLRDGDRFAEGSVRIWVDHTAPFPPTIIRPAEGEVLRNPDVVIEGATEPYATVHLRLDDDWLDPIDVMGSGAFACSVSLGSDGEYSLVAKAADHAGNESGLSEERLIIIDTAAPSSPTLTSPADGQLLTEQSVIVSGEAQQGSWLEILVDGGVVVSQWIDATGMFSTNLTTPTPDGMHRLAVRASSAPGAGWVQGDSSTIYVDLAPPGAPIILQPAESSYVATDEVTLSGSSEPKATVTVYRDEEEIDVVTADHRGVWGMTAVLPTVDGAVRFQATATDTAGHQGAMAPVFVLFVDKTPAALEILEPTADSLFTANPVTIRGESDPDASVWVDGVRVPVNATGQFETDVSLAEGPDTVVVLAEDPAGNQTTAILPLWLDTVVPFLTLTSPEDSLITQTTNIAVAGTTEPGSQVAVQGGAVNVDQGGAFSTIVPVSYGWNTITVEATDQAGWENSVERTVIVDAIPTEPDNLEPDHGGRVNIGRPILTMDPASDGNGDDLTYTIAVYRDASLSNLVLASPAIAETDASVIWALHPELDLDGSMLYWRARAFDGVLYGAWSDVATFRVIDVGTRDPHRFFGYGDSITAGSQWWNENWAENVPSGYRPALELALSVFLGDATVDYAVVGGGNTQMALDSIDELLAGENGAYLLLNIGALDANGDLDLQQARNNIAAMAQYASSEGFFVILSTVTPNAANQDANNRVIQLNTLITQLAQQQNYPLADHYAAMEDAALGDLDNVMSGDGLHPNDFGYSVMAQAWYETIIGSDQYPVPNFLLTDEFSRLFSAGSRVR